MVQLINPVLRGWVNRRQTGREREFQARLARRSAELCARRPVFIGDFCALANQRRMFGVDRLAERDEPESNTLWAVEKKGGAPAAAGSAFSM